MAFRTKLPDTAVKAIHAAVDDLFARAKTRMLGFPPVDKRVSFSPTFSIPGLFTAASRDEAANPDAGILKTLLSSVSNYIDSYKEASKAKVTRAVDSWLQEAALSGVKTDVETVLGGELAGVWGKVTTDMKRLVDTEASNARATGALDGILRVNAAHEIEDPVVYFVVVHDSSLCDECKRLHLLEDGITPRAWYVSEIGHGYHKKGESNPKLGGLHPHCRCSIVTLMPGFGFKAGAVSFIGRGYSEIDEQRKTEKSQSDFREDLQKMAIADLRAASRGVKKKASTTLGAHTEFDYSHLLPPERKAEGYSLHVGDHTEEGHGLRAIVHHNGARVGDATAGLSRRNDPSTNKLQIGFSGVEEAHQKKGLGVALYEALYSHAYHKLGIREAEGDQHSTSAHRVHAALARKHGLDYSAGKSKTYTEELTQQDLPDPDKPFDNRYGPYSYALKSEGADSLEKATKINLAPPPPPKPARKPRIPKAPKASKIEADPDLETDPEKIKDGFKYKLPQYTGPIPNTAAEGRFNFSHKISMRWENGNLLERRSYDWQDWDKDKIKAANLLAYAHPHNQGVLHRIGKQITDMVGAKKPGLLRHFGLIQQHHRDSPATVNASGLYSSGGQRGDRGHILLSEEVAHKLMRAGDPEDEHSRYEEWDGLKTLTHEYLHAASHEDHQYEPEEYPTRPHAALEEASTEILAHHFLPSCKKALGFDDGYGEGEWSGSADRLVDWSGERDSEDLSIGKTVSYHRFCEQFAKIAAVAEGLEAIPNDQVTSDQQIIAHEHRLDNAVKYWALKIKRHGHQTDKYGSVNDKTTRAALLQRALLDQFKIPAPAEGGSHPYWGSWNRLSDFLWGGYPINGGKINTKAKPGFMEGGGTVAQLRAFMKSEQVQYAKEMRESEGK